MSPQPLWKCVRIAGVFLTTSYSPILSLITTKEPKSREPKASPSLSLDHHNLQTHATPPPPLANNHAALPHQTSQGQTHLCNSDLPTHNLQDLQPTRANTARQGSALKAHAIDCVKPQKKKKKGSD